MLKLRTYSHRGFIYSYYCDNTVNVVKHEFMETRNPGAIRALSIGRREPLDEASWRKFVDKMIGADRP